ncbi:ribose-5-phosphate isomerase RpiA [Basilea psittacipulmonis]|uniref:Ribose-5-phosphate isomerase A n=1 Tax=Basilea psittacipulmonis DSM 24701 TaxID=1072685 RepID=A0A077DDU6_9BURK|nr:ribose-5-phosphate isomerase RpiA [Basilea psittacipulmonis]AIL32784.1 ribose 5-phosphate isomerase [Basilea psittacipulmonis DSM 24701]
MLTQDQLKQAVAKQALSHIRQHLIQDAIIGIGTGSTADFFIDALAEHRHAFRGAVASSERSAKRLAMHGIRVFDLNEVDELAVYVDGADEINAKLEMIKGGGGALTREKIVASASHHFVCIVDESKVVDNLGAFPLPIEVLAISKEVVSRQLYQLGATEVIERKDFLTDNGHPILDVKGLKIEDAARLEAQINDIPGVVTCGLFAIRPATVALVGTQEGVKIIGQTADPRYA